MGIARGSRSRDESSSRTAGIATMRRSSRATGAAATAAPPAGAGAGGAAGAAATAAIGEAAGGAPFPYSAFRYGSGSSMFPTL